MNHVTRIPVRVRHTPRLRLLQVARAEALSPRMRRIVLAGPELEGFASAAPDDHVKLFFPAAGQEQPVLPRLGPEGPMYPDGAVRPAMRDYTPRHFDPQRLELAIDFVLHGDGPASLWAAQASAGQWLGVGGPRGSLLTPEDYDVYLLAGDETALPAIAGHLEAMRPGARAHVLIEVADAGEQRHLPSAANATIAWLPRDGTAPGQGRPLLDALRRLDLPAGDTHAWLAGEIEAARSWRRHLLEERGLPREHVRAAGYWRLGAAGAHGSLND